MSYSPEKEIVITNGCAEALNNVMLSVINPGEMLIVNLFGFLAPMR